MKEIYSPYAEKIKKQERKEGLTGKLLTMMLIGGLAIAAYSGLKQKPIEYSGEKSYTFEEGQGLSDATMTVERDVNKVPYQEVNKHIAEMPQNEKSLSDGIQAGETITVPESAERQ
jgi:hypothetical protein